MWWPFGRRTRVLQQMILQELKVMNEALQQLNDALTELSGNVAKAVAYIQANPAADPAPVLALVATVQQLNAQIAAVLPTPPAQ